MGNYISADKKSAKKKSENTTDYKTFHKYDRFYSDVKFYKTPITIK